MMYLWGMKAKRSRTSRYYDENPEAREKKKRYDKKYHSSKERKKYRAELNRLNRKAGTYGNGDGLKGTGQHDCCDKGTESINRLSP